MAADRSSLERLRRRERRWDAERIATLLVSKRDRLVEQLPRELAAARGLTRDQRELVIDEAIDFIVTEYAKPIADEDVLARAFWATAAFRVKRVHEGRGAMVRAGWRRVDVDDFEIASSDNDPAAQVVRAVEQGTLLEFAATLTQLERLVLAYKFADGTREPGRVVIAQRLGMRDYEVRRAERAIVRKLDRFAAVVSSGSLCTHRGGAIEALANGAVTDDQERLARMHLEHCSGCRATYAEYLRALRSGELQRRIAQLLPLPAAAEQGQRRSAWDVATDWVTRPFTSDAATTGTQIAATGRGIGTIAGTKLAMLCIGGATVLGGATYCVTNVLQPEAHHEPPQKATPARDRPMAAKPHPRLPSAGATLVAVRKAASRRAVTRARVQAAKPTAAPRRGGRPATRHEREVPISPPVQTGSQPTAEFGPAPAGPVSPAPAAPPATRAPEFP